MCEGYFRYHTYAGKLRKIPKFGPQSDEKFPESSDKLLFLLIYLKNNALQEFHAAYYDISQGQVSNLVRVLMPLLDQALGKMGFRPCRDSQSLKNQLRDHPDRVFSQDATQRPIGRKVDYEAQKEDFSGKSKDHTDKNHLLCDDASQILYLSPTYEGSIHDKALLDEENIQWLPHISLRQDTGYQGYAPENVTIIQPTKKPRGTELTDAQKQQNKAISKERVIIENAIAGLKRLRILKDRIRHKCYDLKDQIMCIGCALHNLRLTSPVRSYNPRTLAWALQ
ncbi:MAG TPA: transposase [Saprospiraceae bacterium]|nr:transposase [Saprospiraceae bacterium]